MTWEPRPVPDVTPETEPFWKGASEGRLLLSECQDCGLVYHYPRVLCPDCFSEDVEWLEADGEGEVYSYSVTRTMSGWPKEDLPLVVAYVELDEGPRLMTNIQADQDVVDVGTRVTVRFKETETNDIAIPVFVPISAER
ncbi:Zn-ribbon domain-containing OB-fold protein [Natronomonas gomsonensis]|uniref:Zn-ribbon domain-containing OB-fold protein n=1 Tax=Natronomonas gomsonensis TaxID=1046043 RepID=UPI0020CA2B3A|nr:Zn-ribbon domain-containing OB-fold protein [Natronomonas gomsonensis]MCY4729910.1 Zn-ribbon domain-containing OB-fold protein [Natronomonas gomsonensis]